jgi:hypothetical protein
VTFPDPQLNTVRPLKSNRRNFTLIGAYNKVVERGVVILSYTKLTEHLQHCVLMKLFKLISLHSCLVYHLLIVLFVWQILKTMTECT